MRFSVDRHYFSSSHFQYGIEKVETKFGKYNIYNVERSVYDMVRLKDEIVIEVLDRMKSQTAQYQRISGYGELLKGKDTTRGEN